MAPLRLGVLMLMQLLRFGLAADLDLRVALCVVGQVGRTEVQTKVDNLIKANSGSIHIDAFLVLQLGKPRSVNFPPAPECSIAPTSLEAAEAAFSQHARTIAFENAFLDVALQEHQWAEYPEHGQRRVDRLTSHFNQYLGLKRCAQLVAAQELADGDLRYDAVIRVRDNSLVLRPFPLRDMLLSLLRTTYEKVGTEVPSPITNKHIRALPVVVKGCASWGGYSDKTMIIPRNHMDAALSSPADEFHLVAKGATRTERNDGIKIFNPETYLKYLMTKLKVPVYEEMDPALFPVTDGRCEDGKSFCVVPTQKDCRPRQTGFARCTFSYLEKRPPSRNHDGRILFEEETRTRYISLG